MFISNSEKQFVNVKRPKLQLHNSLLETNL